VDFHGWGHLGAAAGDGFGGFLDFDQAHPAVAGYFETFVVAEARDFDAVFLGGLEDGEIVVYLVRLVIDKDFNLLGGKGSEGPEQPLDGSHS